MYKSTFNKECLSGLLLTHEVTHQGISVCNVFLCYVLKICFILWSFVQVFREKILQLLQTRSAMFNLKVRCMTTENLMKKKKIYLDLFCLLASKTLNTITSRIEPCYKYFKRENLQSSKKIILYFLYVVINSSLSLSCQQPSLFSSETFS